MAHVDARICLVTPGQPSTNPRLVKEADALAEAGYEVQVVACKYQAWADEADAAFSDRDWSTHWLHYGPMASRPRDLWQRLRRRASKELVGIVGTQSGLTERAFHYAIPELTRHVREVPADLYIAHNLAALPAAYRAAQAHEAALGFDAEDFHRGELPDTPKNDLDRRITADLEERYIPRCDYVTAASEGIGAAYADVLEIEPPTTILNVFPWSEREHDISDTGLATEVPDGKRSLYWFSQTIGPDRGLEDALRALPSLSDDVILSLRGQWSPGYEDAFRGKAEQLGVADRIQHLDLVPPDELIPRTAQHDVGLALEQPSVSTNRTICLTNKLFTYLLAGVPFVATDTPGQRAVVEDLPEVARLYAPGAVEAFSERVADLLAASGLSEQALQAARGCYCWEVEKEKFLRVIETVLSERAPKHVLQ
ncbi:glycosyltransferase involved in cell wall biosynthesis [Salinibacter ruber]|uniref:glycosyltransferase n=1 Tax=Salinibacter ruber TaxID=146919 RepID=UPI002169D666|nr:glycosyltransferase [Salinibacter ruber]MCS3956561.1 glycosyltransferase involved in cell wall biosynthesis [Salinibacter ruber]